MRVKYIVEVTSPHRLAGVRGEVKTLADREAIGLIKTGYVVQVLAEQEEDKEVLPATRRKRKIRVAEPEEE